MVTWAPQPIIVQSPEVEQLRVQLAELQTYVGTSPTCDCASCINDDSSEGQELRINYSGYQQRVGPRTPANMNRGWCAGCGGSLTTEPPVQYGISKCAPDNCRYCDKSTAGWKVNYPALAKLSPTGAAFVMKSIKDYGALRKMGPDIHREADAELEKARASKPRA
jgi:hypothetical protein